MEIHRSSFKRGVAEEDLRDAVDNAPRWFHPDSDLPKVLAIGRDRSGNPLEVIALELADDRWLVIHTMALRAALGTAATRDA